MDKLPKRDDAVYQSIESFQKYELTTCISYEMAIRNNKNIVNVKNFVRKYIEKDFVDNHYEQILEQTNFKASKEDSYKLTENMIDPFSLYLKNYPFFEDLRNFVNNEKNNYIKEMERRVKIRKKYLSNQDYSTNLTVAKKIIKIQSKLLEEYKVYAKKNKLKKTLNKFYSYMTEKELKELEEYKYSEEFDKLFFHQEKYNKIDKLKKNKKITYNHLAETQFFSFYTRYFENKETSINRLKPAEIIPKYSRPNLLIPFEFNKTVKLNLNLTLPFEELKDILEKVKDDFDNNNFIKAPLEIIGKKLGINYNEYKNMNSKEWADCFFIYDYIKQNSDLVTDKYNDLIEILTKYNGYKVEKAKNEQKKGEPKIKIVKSEVFKECSKRQPKIYENKKVKNFYSLSTIKSRHKLMKSLIDDNKYQLIINPFNEF